MFTNYWIYLIYLPKEEQFEQLVIILISFLILFIISLFLFFLKLKFQDKTKNKLFKKFLEKI